MKDSFARQLAAAVAGVIADYPIAETRPTQVPNALLTSREVEARLHVTRATLWNWTQRGILHPVKLGRMIRYRRDEIERIEREGVAS